MGGFAHTNVAAATLRTQYPQVAQVQDGAFLYAGVASGTNTITASLTPALSAYANGQRFTFISGGTNTTTSTLNINGLGAITIKDPRTGLALVGNEMLSGSVYSVVYYNSAFWLQNGSLGSATWSPTLVGWSVTPTLTAYRYSIHGKSCTLFAYQAGSSTSNTTTVTLTLPFTAATVTNMSWTSMLTQTADASVYQTTPGIVVISSAATTAVCYKTAAAGIWTNSGNKLVAFGITYEIA